MNLRRLAGVFCWHMGGEPSSRAQEAMASITCRDNRLRMAKQEREVRAQLYGSRRNIEVGPR